MPGGGDVEYFENYSSLVAVEGVGNPRALPLPILRREAGGGTGIWGGVAKGCAFAPAVPFSMRGLREPSQDGPAKREGGGISGGRGVCVLGAA